MRCSGRSFQANVALFLLRPEGGDLAADLYSLVKSSSKSPESYSSSAWTFSSYPIETMGFVTNDSLKGTESYRALIKLAAGPYLMTECKCTTQLKHQE